MQEANSHLSAEQARHLTVHGVMQNEDGTYSWKFDNYVRNWPPYDMTREEIDGTVVAHRGPVLLMRGTQSWHSDPQADGRMAIFKTAELATFEGAGHWVHHDRLELFMARVQQFLAAGNSLSRASPSS